MTCPLDGKAFEAWQDFSGTSFGRRLDLKSLGPTASPWALATCPQCHLPLYKNEFTSEEKDTLRLTVKSPEFLRAVAIGSAYACLGVVREQLKADPYVTADAYLQASWQLETKEGYADVARAAIRWYDVAAPQLKEPERDDDQIVSLYAPIELLRRTGQFDAAAERLTAFPTDRIKSNGWLAQALTRQQTLIAAKDSGTDEGHTVEAIENERPKPKPRRHAMTAANPAETALLAGGQRIGRACGWQALEEGLDKIVLVLDSASGRFIPPLPRDKDLVLPGTKLVDAIWETGGTFSLRHADAFGGREIVFDDEGIAIAER